MPRGKTHGGRRRRRGQDPNRELLVKEDGEEYAQIVKLLGSERMEVMCMDQKRRIAKVRGKFKNRVYVHVNDIVLVCLREVDDTKCDIVQVYFPDEAKKLKQMGEIPSTLEISEGQSQRTRELDIEFGGEEKADASAKPKTEKQNLDDLMPDSDSESEEEDEPRAPVKKPAEKDVKAQAKGGQPSYAKNTKPDSSDEEDRDSESNSDDDNPRGRDKYDPLNDI